MREAYAELGKPLPQVPFLARPGLPAGLQDLMGGERSALSYQLLGQVQGF